MVEASQIQKIGLCILAGEGDLPVEVAEKAKEKYDVVMIGIRGVTTRPIDHFKHIWLKRIQLGKIIKYAQQKKSFLVAGRFQRALIKRLALDWTFIQLIFPALRALMGGDDHFSRFIMRTLPNKYGFQIIGIQEVVPQLLAPQGTLTRRAPHSQEKEDIARAIALLTTLSPFDVGQGVVVAHNRIIAIEAADGTDAMLKHVQAITPAWKHDTDKSMGVLVKMTKVNQVRRIDLPVIGVKTVEEAAHAGLCGIAFEAGGTLIVQCDDVIRKANEHGIFLYGFNPK